MRRELPSIAFLRAFEACARHLSVSRAGEELFLTQSAVSRQLAGLETQLGVKLFHRVRQRLVMTAAGAAYATEIRVCLSHIETATSELMTHQGAGGTLTLSVAPTFGTRWLMPRMPRFQATYPNITVNMLNFTAQPRPLDFAAEHVDAAICFGDISWPDVTAHYLMDETRVPICSPHLLSPDRVTNAEDLARHTLLQHTTRPRAWSEWFAAAGAPQLSGLRGPQFQHMAMVVEAAIAGLGIGLMARFLVEAELQSGRLVIPHPCAVRSRQAYYLAYPQNRQDLPALRAFRGWLMAHIPHPVLFGEAAAAGA